MWLFASAVSSINLLGYLVAFLAVCWYNLMKLQAMQAAAATAAPQPTEAEMADETAPLKGPKGSAAQA